MKINQFWMYVTSHNNARACSHIIGSFMMDSRIIGSRIIGPRIIGSRPLVPVGSRYDWLPFPYHWFLYHWFPYLWFPSHRFPFHGSPTNTSVPIHSCWGFSADRPAPVSPSTRPITRPIITDILFIPRHTGQGHAHTATVGDTREYQASPDKG